MNPPVAARAAQTSQPLAARSSQGSVIAARALLHRRGLDRHSGYLCQQSGQWRGTGEGAENGHQGGDRGRRSRRARLSGLGQAHRQAALQYPAQMVRTGRRQSRGPRADSHLRAGQAAGGIARRSRYRRGLYRVLRRRGAARLWRDHSDAAAGCAAARDQAADRRLWRDHAVEFPELDDHPQGFAGAGGRLHRGAETRQRDAALGAGARGAGREGRRAQGRAQHHDRQFVGDRQGACANIRRCALSASPDRPKSARSCTSRPRSA